MGIQLNLKNQSILQLAIYFGCALTFLNGNLSAHCQMPCGIYHDQMVYDKIDEFYETMFKAISSLNDNTLSSNFDKNQFIRWVITKEQSCDEIALLITKYFLQQKIKPDDNDSDTTDLLKSMHKLLFMLVQIKQNADLKFVKEFGQEWDHFKDLFHPEDKCRESTAPKEWKSLKSNHTHDENDDHHHHDEDSDHHHDNEVNKTDKLNDKNKEKVSNEAETPKSKELTEKKDTNKPKVEDKNAVKK